MAASPIILSLLYPAFFFLAILGAVFLFWRAARHELIDSSEAFDLVTLGSMGAVIFARFFDFVFKSGFSDWHIARLLFFNRYGGFDFYGAIVGIFVATFIYLRSKKLSVLSVLDLAAAPILFGQTIVVLGAYLSGASYTLYSLHLVQFTFYLLLFVVLKRLSAKKRHPGFFICFYLVSIFVFDLAILGLREQLHWWGKISYEFAAPAALLVLGISAWYALARRNLKEDVKWLFGLVLLSIFRTVRMVGSADEAGKFSKSIILVPYYLARSLFGLILVLTGEVRLAFLELLYVFGLRRFLK